MGPGDTALDPEDALVDSNVLGEEDMSVEIDPSDLAGLDTKNHGAEDKVLVSVRCVFKIDKADLKLT